MGEKDGWMVDGQMYGCEHIGWIGGWVGWCEVDDGGGGTDGKMERRVGGDGGWVCGQMD